MIEREEILEALRPVQDPELRRSIVDLGMVRDVQVEDNVVRFTIALTTRTCPFCDEIVEEARAAVAALPGVSKVEIALDQMTPQERAALFQEQEEPSLAQQLSQIQHVVAVMSGKGGVGKSVVTALLAVALRRAKQRVGILDADLTGPSIPTLFGVHARPTPVPVGLTPPQSKEGISIISMNLILPREDDAVIWRGPIIGGMIQQFWSEVLWGDLDYLLVDLPPGTSDAPLTVMQALPLDGVVLVTSPQQLSHMVVRKARQMARLMEVPVLGVVENMSYYLCPDTGKRHEVFGPSRGEQLADELGVPFLGRLPLDPDISLMSDAGRIERYRGDLSIAGHLMEVVTERRRAR